jgi:ribosomal protein S27E
MASAELLILGCVGAGILLLAFRSRLFGSSNTAGGYQRVISPESDLKIACRRCGHVSRAFDVHCPQCGAQLSGKSGGGALWVIGAMVIVIIGGVVLYMVARNGL